MAFAVDDVQRILDSVPLLHRGPGGALAVLRNGELIAEKTWGYANLSERIAITPQTLMPICSISKQMTCVLLIDLEDNPTPEIAANGAFDTQVANALRKLLPQQVIWDAGLTVKHMCDMQSGLRDYWALAMLWGAKPDDRFTIEGDGKSMLPRFKSFHFGPGTEYSYSNTNFYLLGRMIEDLTKQPLPKLLAERVFRPANMTTAQLVPDTAQQPGDCVGYEGNEQDGYLPVINRIEWSGDAGITASLRDMVAYEKHFDKRWTTDDRYRQIASAQTYKDGQRAPYAFGLQWSNIEGVDTVGHGGGLRGWRLQRRYVPRERLSVLVMLNQEKGTVGKIAEYIIRKVLSLPEAPSSDIEPLPVWFGSFLDDDTQLAVTVSQSKKKGHVAIKYVRDTEDLRLVADDRAESPDVKASIDGDTLTVMRVGENRKLVATRISEETVTEGSHLQGSYRCGEMETTFVCEGTDNMLYGAFDGPLGRGPANLMRRLGENVWTWACPRALDHTPPGDWTVVFHQSSDGSISGCTVGCWLARRVVFERK